MKVIIVLASFIGLAAAGSLYGAAPLDTVSTGSSSQFRSEDNYGNYAFGYDESHASGGSSRREEESNGVRRGSYSLHDADGRRRLVTFFADETGFHANVETNEPGVDPKDSADVIVNKEDHPVAAPAYNLPAPVLAAPAPILAAPAPLPIRQVAPLLPARRQYAAPLPVAAPILRAEPLIIETPAPRAFSYSYGATHAAPVRAAPEYNNKAY